jgi:hypothetical protein
MNPFDPSFEPSSFHYIEQPTAGSSGHCINFDIIIHNIFYDQIKMGIPVKIQNLSHRVVGYQPPLQEGPRDISNYFHNRQQHTPNNKNSNQGCRQAASGQVRQLSSGNRDKERPQGAVCQQQDATPYSHTIRRDNSIEELDTIALIQFANQIASEQPSDQYTKQLKAIAIQALKRSEGNNELVLSTTIALLQQRHCDLSRFIEFLHFNKLPFREQKALISKIHYYLLYGSPSYPELCCELIESLFQKIDQTQLSNGQFVMYFEELVKSKKIIQRFTQPQEISSFDIQKACNMLDSDSITYQGHVHLLEKLTDLQIQNSTLHHHTWRLCSDEEEFAQLSGREQVGMIYTASRQLPGNRLLPRLANLTLQLTKAKRLNEATIRWVQEFIPN